MKSLRINAWVYGGEFVIGTVPKKTALYWEERGEEDFIEHVYQENLDLDTVPEEHQLPLWYEIDDLEHGNSITLGSSNGLTIEDTDTNETIMEIELDDEFLEGKLKYDESTKLENLVKNLDDDMCLFFGQSIEKGTWTYGEGDFYLDDNDEFDPNKLSFTATFVDEDVSLSTIDYEGKLDAEGNPNEYDVGQTDGNRRGVSSNFFFYIDGRYLGMNF